MTKKEQEFVAALERGRAYHQKCIKALNDLIRLYEQDSQDLTADKQKVGSVRKVNRNLRTKNFTKYLLAKLSSTPDAKYSFKELLAIVKRSDSFVSELGPQKQYYMLTTHLRNLVKDGQITAEKIRAKKYLYHLTEMNHGHCTSNA